MNMSLSMSLRVTIAALIFTLSGCASSGPVNLTNNVSPQPERPAPSQLDKDSTSSIAQITRKDQEEANYQITDRETQEPLTVDQLRNYVDRCGPENLNTASPEIDCSELGLRIQRAYKTEDQVTDALITLDRLGRNASAENVSDDLRDGRADNSLNAQAIASGIFEPAPPTPEAPPPPEEIEDLITNSLIDTIIANSQNR